VRTTLTGLLFLIIAALPYIGMVSRSREARPPRQPTGPVETLRILSPHRREVRLEYSRAFAEWLQKREGRSADIVWLDVGGTSKMLKEIESRFQANPESCGVDLMFGGGLDPFIAAVRQNWLEPLSPLPDTLAGIPPSVAGSPLWDPGGHWFGVALSSFGILYNRPLLQRLGLPEPREWADLARPEFRTWVGSGDPRSSGSVHMCYEIILQALGFEEGWRLIVRLCANVRTFGESGGTVPREVAAGDIAAGMVIDQYGQTVIAAVGGDRLALVLPARQTVVNADPIALLRGAPNRELAQRFIAFTLSPEGQRLLFQPAGVHGQRATLYRMPVRPELYAEPYAPAVNPFDMPATLLYDSARGSKRWTLLNDLIGAWLIDAHAGLRRAWEAVIRRGLRPEEVALLTDPPLSETDLMALAERWNDSRLRQETIARWSREADARYRSLLTTPSTSSAP
jgi:iron(III) transport system substrate-binding protein